MGEKSIMSAITIAFVIAGSISIADPLVPSTATFGYVQDRHGNFINNVLIYIHEEDWGLQPELPQDYTIRTDDNGFWEVNGSLSSTHVIFVSASNATQDCYPFVYGDPQDLQGNPPLHLNVDNPNINFLASPIVSGRINDGYSIPGSAYYTTAKGTVVIVDNRIVDILEGVEYVYSFQPDKFNPPLEYSGFIGFQKQFHEFLPANDGVFSSYDCNGTTHFQVIQSQAIYIDDDIPATKSWKNPPGSIGHSFFPLTPDNRVANNPNIWAEIGFYNLGTVVSKNDIYLSSDVFGEIYPLEDLTFSNSYRAVFVDPIANCAFGEVVMLAKTSVKYYEYERFVPIGMGEDAWITSTSNVDLTGDGVIDLADSGALGVALGSCFGDLNYNPCADFFPDDQRCIDLNEIGIYSTIFYLNGQKTIVSEDIGLSITGEVCPADENEECAGLFVTSNFDWDAVLIEFDFGDNKLEEISWNPAEIFEGRSILKDNPNIYGNFGLFLFGPTASGTIPIGELRISKSEKDNNILVVRSGVHYIENSEIENRVESSRANSYIEAFPNPFNPDLTISLSLNRSCRGELSIFSIDGKLVTTLKNGFFEAGVHEIPWQGRNSNDMPVGSGNYFYVFNNSDGEKFSGKITLLK